jgi:hypothetical protein
MANRRFIDFPIAASVGDNDIVLIWQDGLNKQTTKATLLQGSPSSLAGLTDVDISALTNGQILQYNSTTSKWENVDRTDINLSELGDVTIVAPANGQVLVYNSSTSKWENSSGGYVPYTGAVTTVNLGAQSILAGSFVKAGGTSAQFLKADGSVDSNTYGTGTVTSVALTMPTAFSVANSPVTTTGTLAVTATGTTAQYIRGDGSLATFPGLTGFVPYTGATADVNLGTHDLAAERGTFANNGSSDTLTVNHTSGSGYGIIVTKGGNNEALYVSKTSGSGNAMTVVGGRTSLVDLALSSVTNTAGDFLTISGGVVHKRTAAQTLTDIGGQAALTNPVTGTGVSGRVAYWNGTNSITSDADLLFDGSNLTVGGNVLVSSTQIIGINTVDGADNGYLAICGASADGSNRGGHIYLSGNERVGDAGSVVIAGGNTTTGSGATAAIVFRTLGTDKVRLTSAGNFGIGTDTPVTFGTKNLDVNGGAGSAYIVARGLNNTGTVEMAFDGGGYIGTKTAHDLVIRTSDVQRINVFATSGNVLVGTGSDNGAKLQVSGTATFSSSITAATLTTIGTAIGSQNVQLNLNGVSGKAQRIEFQNSGVQQWLIGAGAASETSAFEIFNSTGIISLSINKSSNLATFSNSITAKDGSLFNANSATLTQDILTVRGGGSSGAFGFRVESNNGEDIFFANNLSYNIIMASIAGNVGIGASNPTLGKLEIQTGSTTAALWVQTGGTTSAYTIADFRTGSNLPALQILGNGNSIFNAKVLVNESSISPQGEQFAVTATNLAAMFKTTGGAANNWAANFWNNATSGNNIFIEFGTETSYAGRGSVTYNRAAGLVTYNTTSDYRIKTEITDFNALTIIENLKPKKFKIGNATQKSIGFIAHELQEFYPQAVHGEKDAEDANKKPIYQGVDYSQLTGLLVKAIQELKQEIDTLKN